VKTYLVKYGEMESDGDLNWETNYVHADSKVEALMKVINLFTTAVYSVSSVERVKDDTRRE